MNSSLLHEYNDDDDGGGGGGVGRNPNATNLQGAFMSPHLTTVDMTDISWRYCSHMSLSYLDTLLL